MSYRDREVAAEARIQALEAEVAQLRSEKAQLRALPPVPGHSLRWGLWIGLGLGGVLLAASAVSGFVVSGYVGEQVALVLVTTAVTAVALGFVTRLVEVAGPNEALIVSGRPRRSPDGTVRGFRIVVGGLVVRIPIVEIVQRLDIRPFEMSVDLPGARLRRDRRATVRFRALVSFKRDDVGLATAIERFLGRPRAEIEAVLGETLQGAAREVLGQLASEQVESETWDMLARALRDSASDAVSLVGFSVDQVQLADVTVEPET